MTGWSDSADSYDGQGELENDDFYEDGDEFPEDFEDDGEPGAYPDDGEGGRGDTASDDNVSIRIAGVGDVARGETVVGGGVRGSIHSQRGWSNTIITSHHGDTVIEQANIIMADAQAGLFHQRFGGSGRGMPRTRDVTALRPRFVAPPGYENAIALLRAHSAVLVTGDAGDGRSIAATMALLSVSYEGPSRRPDGAKTDGESEGHVAAGNGSASGTEMSIGAIRILETLEELRENGSSWPGPDEIEPGERLYLDLTRPAEAFQRGDTERLLDLLTTVRVRSAWLAAVVSRRTGRGLPPELVACQAVIGRPDPVAVLARHLRADGLERSLPEIEAEIRRVDDGHQLAGFGLEMIARIALGSPRDAAGTPVEGPSQWLPDAIKAASRDFRDSFRTFAERTNPEGADEPSWRIRLACVAMLEGSTVATVTAAERELTRVCSPAGEPSAEPHPFARPDLDSWLGSVGAVRFDAEPARSSRVRFERSADGIAVRRYFWAQHPHLVEIYLRWFDGLCRGSAGERPEGRAAVTLLAGRIAEQMLDAGTVDELLRLSRRWMKVENGTHLAAAATALRLGLEDETSGWRIRGAFYDWSQSSRLPANSAKIIIELCVDPLAIARPDMAVTRLMHFLGHENEGVRDAAATAVIGLAARDERYRLVLTRVARLLAEASPVGGAPRNPLPAGRQHRRRQQAAMVFLKLAAVDRLARGHPDVLSGYAPSDAEPMPGESQPVSMLPEDLVGSWRFVLDWVDDQAVLTDRVADWLGAAGRASDPERLLDVLAHACGRRVDRQNRLAHLALTAARDLSAADAPLRKRSYRELLDRIVRADEERAEAMAVPPSEASTTMTEEI